MENGRIADAFWEDLALTQTATRIAEAGGGRRMIPEVVDRNRWLKRGVGEDT